MITGLSADQLREWSGRRGLIAPDVPACGKGTQARFSWQTLLLLRIAGALKTEIHVELEAYRDPFAVLREQLARLPFHALWDVALVIAGNASPMLRALGDIPLSSDEPLVIVGLRPHLDTIMRGFGIAEPVAQLPLFPAVGLR
ncbi:hypothetical protein [Sphingobium sp. B11D3A]|uniref:hypothetical protein n=1 Tax=Sphingobium sp. B11D3A TaxID=2940574 RepID=UPI0022245D8B|nr:hypothetical protein [Sphingobium sp. B11D3A]MCW2393547.1 hypothetical protein [Sphingobium sp. B11D3A]